MSHESKHPHTKSSQTWADETEQLDEILEITGTQPVPIGELLRKVDELETHKLPDDELDSRHEATPRHAGPSSSSEELISMLKHEENLLKLHKVVQEKRKERATEKPHVEDLREEDGRDYQESFASQQETAQLREDFDQISEKFHSLEQKFDLLMKERENLPVVLNNMRADLNNQLTSFSDKLYSILENQTSRKEVASTLASIDEVRIDHADQLKTATSYLTSDPSIHSPLVNKGSTLKGKGKFKPIK